MLELDWDIVWTIVNLLILFLLLKHFLFKPITQMMESRTAEIENNLKDAEEQKQKAQQLNTQYEEQLQGAQAQAAQIISDAKAQGQKEYSSILKTAQADAALANAQVNGAVLAQTLQNSEELSQKAQEYGISTGKAALIQAIVAGSNNTKTFEDLVGLSINELNLLYTAQAPLEGQTSGNEQNTGAANAAPITTSGSASQSAYIGPEAAKEAALKHAGFSSSDATFVEAEYDYDDGRMVYEVEFYSGNKEYDYEIDAVTGTIVGYDYDIENYTIPSS